MKRYYVSRGVIAIIFGGLIYLASKSWLAGLLGAILILTTFIYLPRSGRYRVDARKGATALRRDEWTQGINQRSGLNAWVVISIAGSGLVLFYGLISPGDVPTGVLGALMLLGFVVYYVSDFWLRKL